jgi:hypothetical protein
MKTRIIFTTALVLATGCDVTSPGGDGSVAIRFGAGSSSAVYAGASAPGISADELTVTGTNGTLVIQDVRFIVEEMELRSSHDVNGCGDDDEDDDGEHEDAEHEDGGECEFEGGPFIVDLPLDGDVTIATTNIPAGTYDSFRFKIDDLEEGDDDEDDDRARTPALLAEMRTVYPDFPSRASLVVKGTQNGQPFTVYFRSKLRISQAIVPPLTIPGDDALTVKIDPASWFRVGNQVLDLLALNGRLVDLEDRFEIGLSGTHRGRD